MAKKSIANLSVSLIARTRKFVQKIRNAAKSLNIFGKQAKKAHGHMGNLSDMLIRMGKMMAAIAAVRMFFGLFRRQEMFNRALRQSQAIMGDLSITMRKDMKRAAIDMARNSIFTSEETGKAFFFLASAGLNATRSIEALPVVTKFAQAGMFDLSLATDLLTDAQSALGLTVEDNEQNLRNMVRVSDVLVKGNTLANATVEQLSEALTNKAAAAMKRFGISVEEGVAALAVFADQGIKGQRGGNAFEIVLREMTSKAVQNTKAFKELEVAVFDTSGNMRFLSEIISDLESAFEGQNDIVALNRLLMLGLTMRSVAYTNALIGTSDKLELFRKGLFKAGTTTDEVSKKMLTPLQESLNKFQASVTSLTESLRPLINALAELFMLPERAGKFVLLMQLLSKDILLRVFGGEGTGFQKALEAAKAVKEAQKQLDIALATGPPAPVELPLRRNKADVKPVGIIDLIPIVSVYRTKLGMLRDATAKLGLSEAALQMRELTKSFSDASIEVPTQIFEEASKAIREYTDRQKALADIEERIAARRERTNRAISDGTRIYEANRTPQEQYVKRMERLRELLADNKLPGGLETFNREAGRLRDSLLGAGRSRAPTTALQISRTRTFVPGLAQQRNREQLVKDPQLARVIELLVESNQQNPSLAFTN